MAVITVPNRKRITFRIPDLDARLVAGILLIALAVLGGLRLFAVADRTVPVMQATRDLPANHVIKSGDLRIARVRVSSAVLETLVQSDSASQMTGKALTSPIQKDALLQEAFVKRVPDKGREITMSVDTTHSLSTTIGEGDRVDVLASFDKGSANARTLTVVSGAEVSAIAEDEGLFGQSRTSVQAVTLSVSPNDAVYLAFALRNAEIDIVRSTGAAKAERNSFGYSEIG